MGAPSVPERPSTSVAAAANIIATTTVDGEPSAPGERRRRTRENYRDSLRQLWAFLNDTGMPTEITHVTREHIEAFIVLVLDRWSASTAETRFKGLQQFFRWAADEGIVTQNPMERMRPPKTHVKPPPVFSLDELRALTKACEGQDFESRRHVAMIAVLLDSGLRLSELTGLQITRDDDGSDLESATGELIVRGKGNKWRVVSIGHETMRKIDRYLRLRKQHPRAHLAYLWLGKRGTMTPSGVRQMVQRRGREAGLGDHVHPHQLRHSWAHHWLAAGGPEGDLQQLAGWSSAQMVRRYGASGAAQRARDAHRQRFGLGDRL